LIIQKYLSTQEVTNYWGSDLSCSIWTKLAYTTISWCCCLRTGTTLDIL